MMIELTINGKTIKEEIPDSTYGMIDDYYYKRKRNHSEHENRGCHYGLCNSVFCYCCGEPSVKKVLTQ